MDGRFLDLETPLVLPYPVVGVSFEDNGVSRLKPEYRSESYERFLGFEVIGYARQMQVFLNFLVSKLRFFIDAGLLVKSERLFVSEFLEVLDQILLKKNLIMSAPRLSERVCGYMGHALQLNGQDQQWLKMHFENSAASLPSEQVDKNSSIQKPVRKTFFRIDEKLARTEPHSRQAIYAPDFIRDQYPLGDGRARAFNQCLIEADESDNIETYFSLLRTAKKYF